MVDDEDLDSLESMINAEQRKLAQLRALQQEIDAGRLADLDQVIGLSVIQDYLAASDDVRNAVRSERLDRVEYGKRLSEFHAACILSAVVTGKIGRRSRPRTDVKVVALLQRLAHLTRPF